MPALAPIRRSAAERAAALWARVQRDEREEQRAPATVTRLGWSRADLAAVMAEDMRRGTRR